jgi:multicomponent Na+:H+ antiporter subunit C
MTGAQLFAVTGTLLFGIGMWAVAALPDRIRKVIGLNIMSVGAFLTIVAIGYREVPDSPDPVPHAMVLTGIVVSISATALALALIRIAGPENPGDHDD